MVVLPLKEADVPFGILEVLSSRPSAFSGGDIETLQSLTHRIVATKREAEQGAMHPLVSVEEDSLLQAAIHAMPNSDEYDREAVTSIEREAEPFQETDLWSTVLVILIVAAAVALGVIVGWRGAAKKRVPGSELRTNPELVQTGVPTSASSPPVRSAAAASPAATMSTPQPLKTGKAAPEVPGLLVTQNGKVIYRESAKPQSDNDPGQSARLVRRVEPEYPAEARSRNLEGAVILDVQVLPDGTVGTIGIVSGDSLLARAAVHAVRQWRYQPNFVNGRPVEGQTRITINFTLPHAN